MSETKKSVEELLKKNISACAERMRSLDYSLNKIHDKFPLKLEDLAALDESFKESTDALLLRYAQCVTMIQDQIFRGILTLEQQDIEESSNRYRTELMEKIGAIDSANRFSSAVILRNKFAHMYPEKSKDQLQKLNQVVEDAKYIKDVFVSVVGYVKKRKLLDVL